MEGVLTDITDPNIVLATITSREAYLATKPKDDDKDTEMVDISMIKVKVAKAPVNSTYINYDDHTREKFIDRMIEGPVRRGRVAEVARQFGIAYNTANRWWKLYNETCEIPYKKSEKNVGRPSFFSDEHEQHIEEIVEQNPQICADNIIDSLTHKFEGFSISKSQMNHHLRNNMFITVKRPTFEAKIRNSIDNLQTRYEWFMKWKDSDIDFDKNCVFIDEASFNINMRNN